jgi:hypothetical protein
MWVFFLVVCLFVCLFILVVSTKIEGKNKRGSEGSEFLGFSDKLQTERAVFFCLSFSGKKNKRVKTDTGRGGRGREGEGQKGKGKEKKARALKAFCPPKTRVLSDLLSSVVLIALPLDEEQEENKKKHRRSIFYVCFSCLLY